MASAAQLDRHLAALRACTRCPRMHRPAVVGRAVHGRVLLVGQAPGDKEPVLGRPFAWTAGKTLFKWFHGALGWSEDEVRDRIYFAAVCRCFPGKRAEGGDRVPAPEEIAACSAWLEREFALLRPALVLPVGKLAIAQFLGERPLAETIGRVFPISYRGFAAECIPLPHPSGASTWHRTEPGKTLLGRALGLVARHEAVGGMGQRGRQRAGSPAATAEPEGVRQRAGVPGATTEAKILRRRAGTPAATTESEGMRQRAGVPATTRATSLCRCQR